MNDLLHVTVAVMMVASLGFAVILAMYSFKVHMDYEGFVNAGQDRIYRSTLPTARRLDKDSNRLILQATCLLILSGVCLLIWANVWAK